jgi:K+/H+ antiporter YhaU regulatory subunit KhtT
MIGKSIKNSEIRNKTGVSVVAIVRDNQFYPNPDPDFTFQQADLIGVIGEFQQLQTFKKYIKSS